MSYHYLTPKRLNAYSSFTAEILNNTLIRTHINNLSELPRINKVLETAAELMNQECSK